ncbi:diaminopimelate decarboxylase-like [Penaeus chinensis]|uniref:diaminopimelate decarboxylase-like n=1 Tax=Penaeus chinensis TaxID=139456 RepID=UPI001FB7B431|nr:diaminopimelate decarboxylase-like [Penaeus chinensis]
MRIVPSSSTGLEVVGEHRLFWEYGSPLFVYDADHIKSQALNLTQAAHGFHISYAIKANSNKFILNILKNNKVECVDVVSPGEIYKALANGYAGHQILYTENFISEEEMDYALSANVIMNIGALDTLNSKFGIYASELDDVARIASDHNIKIIGLHQHIGSNLKKHDQEVFLNTTEYIFKLLQKFPDATKVNIGGGLGIKYQSNDELLDVKDLYDQVKKYRDQYSTALSREIQLWI